MPGLLVSSAALLAVVLVAGPVFSTGGRFLALARHGLAGQGGGARALLGGALRVAAVAVALPSLAGLLAALLAGWIQARILRLEPRGSRPRRRWAGRPLVAAVLTLAALAIALGRERAAIAGLGTVPAMAPLAAARVASRVALWVGALLLVAGVIEVLVRRARGPGAAGRAEARQDDDAPDPRLRAELQRRRNG